MSLGSSHSLKIIVLAWAHPIWPLIHVLSASHLLFLLYDLIWPQYLQNRRDDFRTVNCCLHNASYSGVRTMLRGTKLNTMT